MFLVKTCHLHILALHVVRGFLVGSITDEHHFTFHSFHLHSGPTCHSTINQTSIDVIFTRRLYLRRSIEYVIRCFAGIDLACAEFTMSDYFFGTGHSPILKPRNHVGVSHVTTRCAHGVSSTSADQVKRELRVQVTWLSCILAGRHATGTLRRHWQWRSHESFPALGPCVSSSTP